MPRSTAEDSIPDPLMHTAREDELDAMLNQARDLAREQRAAAAAEEGGMGPFSIQQASANFPEFNIKEPEIWFSQLEIFFKFANITRDGAKLYNVLHRLPKDIFSRIAIDLTDNLPDKRQYEWLKKLLCKIYCKSDTRKAEAILNLRQLGTSHPSALLNEVRSLIPHSHSQHECSKCGHVDKLPPCPIAYTQFRTRLPPPVRRELPPAPESWGEVATDLEESWEAHTSLQANQQVNHVNQQWPGNSEQLFQPAPSTSVSFAPTNAHLPPEDDLVIAAANYQRFQPGHSSSKVRSVDPTPLLCQHHLLYGENALRCQAGCGFYKASKPQGSSSPAKGKGKGKSKFYGNKKRPSNSGN